MTEREQSQAMLDNDVAKSVKEFRKQCGWTQEELASKTGYTKVFINRIENGTAHISVECQSRLCKAFNTSFPELINGRRSDQCGKNARKDISRSRV